METFEFHYQQMRATIASCMPGTDMTLIDRAVEYARKKHKEQTRKDGSPYIIHPLAVAEIVAEYFLKNCKNQYQNGGMFHTSRHNFHSE